MGEFQLNSYALILWMTLFQAVLFAVIALVRAIREDNYSDFWLAGLLILLGFSAVPHFLGWMSIAVLWNDWTFYPWNGLELAIVPTAFLFLRSRLNHNWRFQRRDFWLYALYAIYFFYHLVIAIQGKDFAKWWWFEVNNRYNLDAVFSFCNAVLFAVLLRQFFRIYAEFQTWTTHFFSDLPPLSIFWIRNFLLAYFLFIVVDVALTIMELTIGAQYDKMSFAYFTVMVLTYYISIFALYYKPNAVLDFSSETLIIPDDEAKSFKIAEKDLFSSEEIADWRLKIEDFIKNKQPFLNPDLRLADVAKHFEMNVSTFSSLMNLCFDQNFNDLINYYRIAAFKQKIEAGKLAQFTLLSLAYESGFNSKTTFNRAFKKETGVSPTEFLKKEKL